MTQYAHVKAVLEQAKRPLALFQISSEITKKFNVRHAETAISARIREIRQDIIREGRTIHSKRKSKRDAYHVYAIVKAKQ